MEKIKIALLVKGNIIATDDIVARGIAIENDNEVSSVHGGVDPANDRIDLSDAIVVEGDMRVKSINAMKGGIIAATGDLILLGNGSRLNNH